MTVFPFTLKIIKKISLAFSLTALSLQILPNTVFAQANEDEIAQLRAQITALSNRLGQLESRQVAGNEPAGKNRPAPAASSWADRVKITGDLRTRYERHDDESKPSARNRSRIRSRVAITAQVNDDWVMSVGLAGGGTDPISTNQTLGGGGTTKDFRLDYAYFEYHGVGHMMLTGGKYKNVFYKPGGQNMIFDGDYRPEGLGLKYAGDNLFFNAATFFMESDDKYNSQDTGSMWGIQAGYRMGLTPDASLTLGASYYNAGLKGSKPFYNNESYRNTLDAAGNYMYDYREVELFAQGDFSLGSQPLRIYGDLVQNQDADKFDTGWVIGGKLGDVNGKGTWELGYAYQDLEADAVYAALADSDFAGGGTDGKGHVLDLAVGIGRKTELGLTYYITQYGKASLGRDIGFDRLHLYMTVGF